jgi:DNA-binding winged helix-turn-helix (wHTH) protein
MFLFFADLHSAECMMPDREFIYDNPLYLLSKKGNSMRQQHHPHAFSTDNEINDEDNISFSFNVLFLQEMERRLFFCLKSKPGEIIDRDTLITQLWPGCDKCTHDENLIQLICKLRRSLKMAGFADAITTIRNKGYKYNIDHDRENSFA